MGMVTAWHDEEHTIILQVYAGSWAWEDVHTACRQSGEMMRTVEGRVDIIADATQSGALPIGGGIMHAHRALSSLPENWGVIVLVTTDRLILLLLSTFIKAFAGGLGQRAFGAPTLYDATRIIWEQRSLNLPLDGIDDETQP